MSGSTKPPVQKPKIAIAGATGRIGSTLIDLLASDPVEVIALTRDPDKAKMPPGVQVVAIDFDSPSTVQDALRGVDRLFISHGTSPRQVTNEIALIDMAAAENVHHIVKLSAMGPATRLNPLAWHMQIEAHLAKQLVASTVLRPSAFADVLKFAAPQVAAGSWAGAAGTGQVNFIDTRDVAEVARLALLKQVDVDYQHVHHLTGARSWTMPQVAEELSRLLGHAVVYTHRTPSQQYAALLAVGLAPFAVDLLIGLDQMFAQSAIGETTESVHQLTGHAPRPLTDWLKDNLRLFSK